MQCHPQPTSQNARHKSGWIRFAEFHIYHQDAANLLRDHQHPQTHTGETAKHNHLIDANSKQLGKIAIDSSPRQLWHMWTREMSNTGNDWKAWHTHTSGCSRTRSHCTHKCAVRWLVPWHTRSLSCLIEGAATTRGPHRRETQGSKHSDWKEHIVRLSIRV